VEPADVASADLYDVAPPESPVAADDDLDDLEPLVAEPVAAPRRTRRRAERPAGEPDARIDATTESITV
jgi:hypothetical protein